MKVKRVEHVGIAVRDRSQAVALCGLLGLQASTTRFLQQRGVSITFVPAGECQIELLEAVRQDSDVGRFLEARGEGLHHICLEVENIDEAVRELLDAGIGMMDQAPRMGSRGHRLAFIDPTSTQGVLIELIE